MGVGSFGMAMRYMRLADASPLVYKMMVGGNIMQKRERAREIYG
jgi:hypothetical protein